MLVIDSNYIYLRVFNSLYSSKPALVNEMLFLVWYLDSKCSQVKKVNYGKRKPWWGLWSFLLG